MNRVYCDSCRFWEEAPEKVPGMEWGKCHRHPPRPFITPPDYWEDSDEVAGRLFTMPTTDADFWCGEAVAREEKKPEEARADLDERCEGAAG